MSLNKIIEFLKTDIRGLIILGIVTSIIAALFYDIAKKQIAKSLLYLQKKKKYNRFKKYLKSYTDGFTAGYAHTSSYRQIALVGEFIIKTCVKIAWCLFSTLLFLGCLVLIDRPLFWVAIIVYAIIITIQYRNLKGYLKSYNLFEETIFGKEYREAAKKSFDEHIEEKIKVKKSDANSN